MLLLDINGVKKYYSERCVLDIGELKIYTGEKIGIVGANGAGKTTLFEIITGRLEPDEGTINMYGSFSYIEQLNNTSEAMSGGEITQDKINEAFAEQSHLMLADEPTSNLDINNIEFLQKRLTHFKGALLIISHDRMLLNKICNKIIELADGKIKTYIGNYADYTEQKRLEQERNAFEYEQYKKEKQRLTETIEYVKGRAKKMKDKPKGMSNLEAKKMKTSISSKRAQIEKDFKAIESRLNKLPVKEKPRETVKSKIDIQEGSKLYSKIAVEGHDIFKAYGERIILNNISFSIGTGEKTALVGANGSGKTTLLKMIIDGDENIQKPVGLKIAYFAQGLEILDIHKTIYDEVAQGCTLTQTQIRNILSRLLFRREDVFKKISVLSGGERVKVALAKIFCLNVNMLILDEPTNYLDIYTIESLQELIADYEGTVLVVSHDREFINGFATQILELNDGKLNIFLGSRP